MPRLSTLLILLTLISLISSSRSAVASNLPADWTNNPSIQLATNNKPTLKVAYKTAPPTPKIKQIKKVKIIKKKIHPTSKVNYNYVAPNAQTFAQYYNSISKNDQSCLVKTFGPKVIQAWLKEPDTTLNLTQVGKIDRCRRLYK